MSLSRRKNRSRFHARNLPEGGPGRVAKPAGGGLALPVTDGLVLRLRDGGYDPDSGTWADESGEGNDYEQPQESRYPSLVEDELNGRSVVRFDGDDDFLQCPNFLVNGQDAEFFIILRGTVALGGANPGFVIWTTAQNDWPLAGSAGSSDRVRMNFGTRLIDTHEWVPDEGVVTSWTLLNASAESEGTHSARQNGLLKSTFTDEGATEFVRFNNYRIGNDAGSGFYSGDVAEVLVYDRVLSAAERAEVVDYLNEAWNLGIALDLGEEGNPVTDGLLLTLAGDQGVDTEVDGETVTAWRDQSGNSNDFLAEDEGNPTLQEDNTIHFGNWQSHLECPRFYQGGEVEVLILLRKSTTNSKGLWAFGSSSDNSHYPFGGNIYDTFGIAGRFNAAGFGFDDWRIYNVRMSADDGFWEQYLSSQELQSQSSFTVGWRDTFIVGGSTEDSSTSEFQGYIAEMVMYNRVLSEAERAEVRDYLRRKWSHLGIIDGSA